MIAFLCGIALGAVVMSAIYVNNIDEYQKKDERDRKGKKDV